MQSITPKTILVTGCGSGLGLAIAKILVNSDFRAVLTARENSLQLLRNEGIEDNEHVWLQTLDVNNYEEQKNLIKKIEERWGGVDILVNNAGLAYRSVVEEMTIEAEYIQIKTNYISPMNLVRLVLPHMRRQRYGRIIQISSLSGLMAMPTMASYSASKFALEGGSEALWYEMRPFGIRVSLIQPAFVRSDSFKKVRYTVASKQSSLNADHTYHYYYHHLEQMIDGLMGKAITTPETLARLVMRTIQRKHPPLRIPVSFDGWLFYLLRRLLPQRIYHLVLYYSLPSITKWVKEK